MNEPEIPELLERMVAFSQVRSGTVGRAVFEQTGEMWQTPDAKPMAFRAHQWLDPERIAFSWKARFPVIPGVALHVEDAYDGEHGILVGRVGGWLQVMKSVGPEVDRGEIIRYLAECPWNPAAYLANPELHWKVVDDQRLQVSCEVDGEVSTVFYQVDAEGRVLEVFCPDRPRMVDGVAVDTPWGGRFYDWKEWNGLRVPTLGEVAWHLPEGDYLYWRGRIVSHQVQAPA